MALYSPASPRAHGPETVYNFEVAGEHVYYVGSDGLLVHNAYIVFQDGVKIVGRSFQQAMVNGGRKIPHALIKTGKRLHGHHIVMKGSFRHWLKVT